MPLKAGTRLGRYEIVATLGAGGMGEVYRAYDPHLRREVAVKIIRATSTGSAGARERFAREARTLAGLSHPNIVAIHDIGNAGRSMFAVMELLHGETLRARVERGALPWRKALEIGAAVADGLGTAHARGLVHHDLKPANIFLTTDGTVKVLDFGLATLRDVTNVDGVSETPAAAAPFGTAAYMSPEQVAGMATDARSDIFALGCVLYEMAGGRRAFARNTPVETMTAILNAEPPELSAPTPVEVRRLIWHCLEKDPAARFQSGRDLAFHLRAVLDSSVRVAPGASTVLWRSLGVVGSVAAAAVAIVALGVFGAGFRSERQPPSPVQSYLLPPEGTVLTGLTFPSFRAAPIAVSPDGEHVIMSVSEPGGKWSLWTRRLDSLEARRLDGTENAAGPFWSPDSRFVGFNADGQLRIIAVAGGPPQTLCEAQLPSSSFPGAAWSPGGDILFGQYMLPLFRVPSGGGSAIPVTELNRARGDIHHCCPAFLPDGRHFLYFIATSDPQSTGVYLGALDSSYSTFLLRSTGQGVFAPPGHLVFRRGSVLMAAPFDDRRLRVTGEAVPLTVTGDAFSVSATGVLVYGMPSDHSKLVWVDRNGTEIEELRITGQLRQRRLSHDGRRLAAAVTDPLTGSTDIWVYDLVRQISTRLTFNAGDEIGPVWSSDDKRIVFTSNRNGRFDLYKKPSDGTGDEVLLYASDTSKGVGSWSRDMRYLIFNTDGESDGQLWSLTLPERTPELLARTAAGLWDGQISPDGRFVAYMAVETAGRHELYVQTFPSGPRWRISSSGARWPKWRFDGKELFFIDDSTRTVMAVEVAAGGFDNVTPQPIFPVPASYGDGWFNTTDGSRFLFAKLIPEERGQPLTLVQNWPMLLRR